MEKDKISNFKNYKSDDQIMELYKNAFSDNSNLIITKLSGGMKNSVYLLDNSGEKVVLKIAPKDESKMISVDRNVLWWENEMLKLMKTINFPSPESLYYDESHNLCESPYLFMSYIPGVNYLENKNSIDNKVVKNIEYEIGKLSSKISAIKKDCFFLPAYPNKTFENNYEFVNFLFELLLNDASSVSLDLGKNSYKDIRDILKIYKNSLNNISNLTLTHTDIWDGNIIINNNRILGIVDFSDLYYCDELMNFYFHTIDGKTSEYFLRGYGKLNLNTDEQIRIEIYRMYVILKMIVDCKLKSYGKFDWMYNNLDTRIKSLTKKI
ncbi:MAG: aminoglycoside phosphotransferase family protein [Bacilli bacterium]|nr:aminoglycoside phosphotransferase family protein [Bacilli bacterium]